MPKKIKAIKGGLSLGWVVSIEGNKFGPGFTPYKEKAIDATSKRITDLSERYPGIGFKGE